MELNFTDEEYVFLAQIEDRFRCAVYADWARKPNPIVMKTMLQIWNRVTGKETRLRESCQHCVLAFLKEVGNAYFVDKAERERRVAEAKAKEESMKAETPKTEKPKASAPKKKATNRKKATTKA